MRAFAIDFFGQTPTLRDLPKPEPGIGEVQIRVGAAAVNPIDWKVAAGALARPGTVFPFPFTLGFDVAGQVSATGDGAAFEVGQEVFGVRRPGTLARHPHGSYAEYMTASPETVALAVRPPTLPAVSAAALPMTGGTALAITRWLDVTEGETLLVVGATGGVGSYVLQLAAARGVRVVGVAAAADHSYARGLGAAEVVDYRTSDVAGAIRAAHPAGVDAVLDLVNPREVLAHQIAPLVRDGGRLASTVFAADPEALAGRGVRAVNFNYQATDQDMAQLAGLVTSGALKAAETTTFPLTAMDRAYTASTSGHVRGKLVITID
ncbi:MULTISPECIES: NADP-dependent oxidoreductase [unclassified Arthrobacter]|uniref:NADP-dependent oxidoreductase n=1 Tax=unclassified Arthrobacter TaxID=235627 RepID=UPI002DF9FCF2|nr:MULTISPECIES: NADP-dependent oxidoreductase [unclassified Arthrobacter]MEC5193127.1 NADPH2:quinone reductase [Arthrobacter sp. MP_M4]MEC5204595.1 NADPH2:quinone reductase [Arthrobacter sp. MP_M7]